MSQQKQHQCGSAARACEHSFLLSALASKPRVSNITFSTVTSATGLPTIAAEPSRPRSSSYWKPALHPSLPQAQQQQQQQQTSTQLKLDADRQQEQRGECAASMTHEKLAAAVAVRPSTAAGDEEQQRNASAKTSMSALSKTAAATSSDDDAPRSQLNRLTAEPSDTKSVISHSNNKFAPQNDNRASAFQKPTTASTTTSTLEASSSSRTAALKSSGAAAAKLPRPTPTTNAAAIGVSSARKIQQQQETNKSLNRQQQQLETLASDESTTSEEDPQFTSVRTLDGQVFERVELDADATLARITEWSFPIFQFAAHHKRTVLTKMAYSIFKQVDLFRIFKLEPTKFFNFFHSLESGYWDIPYHNRIHAADVLHSTFYLTCHPVSAFAATSSFRTVQRTRRIAPRDKTRRGRMRRYRHSSSAHAYRTPAPVGACDSDNVIDSTDDEQNFVIAEDVSVKMKKLKPNDVDEEEEEDEDDEELHFIEAPAVPLAQNMSTLELMALYTAAAMHDYDHPGRTNAFLVAIEDEKAIMYNDRSVLENHHAAESWRLLMRSENKFIANLDAAEFKRFRYLVLEYILATDLKQHFDIILEFNDKINDIELTNEAHRLIIARLLIKFADINSPSKPQPLHRQWTERICREFYEQGDDEKRRHMQVSPYMDRSQPSVAKLQDSFIAHMVNPLAVALNEVGLLPVLPGLQEPEIIINLKHNHQKWLLEIEETTSTNSANESTESTDVAEEPPTDTQKELNATAEDSALATTTKPLSISSSANARNASPKRNTTTTTSSTKSARSDAGARAATITAAANQRYGSKAQLKK